MSNIDSQKRFPFSLVNLSAPSELCILCFAKSAEVAAQLLIDYIIKVVNVTCKEKILIVHGPTCITKTFEISINFLKKHLQFLTLYNIIISVLRKNINMRL